MKFLAEGDGWVVIAKPPRLLVHRRPDMPEADALLQQVRDAIGRRVYPIHRIDFQASGCVLFATRQELAGPLSLALASPEAVKTYLALVRGEFAVPGPLLVEFPMKDDQGVLREAKSELWRIAASQAPRCSLLKVEPHTGRFHQVRRHVRDLNHPILGDTKHGDSRANIAAREWGIHRLGLHAWSLDIPNPHGGRIHAVCPLFDDQYSAFSALPWWETAVTAYPELLLPALPLPAEVPPC